MLYRLFLLEFLPGDEVRASRGTLCKSNGEMGKSRIARGPVRTETSCWDLDLLEELCWLEAPRPVEPWPLDLADWCSVEREPRKLSPRCILLVGDHEGEVFRREEERIQKVCRCWIEPMLLCACGACHCLLLFVQVAFGGGPLSFSLDPFRRISKFCHRNPPKF